MHCQTLKDLSPSKRRNSIEGMTVGNFCLSLTRLYPAFDQLSAALRVSAPPLPRHAGIGQECQDCIFLVAPRREPRQRGWGGVGRRWARRDPEQHQRGRCTARAFHLHAVVRWRHCASLRYNPFQSSPQSGTNPHHPLINTVPRRHNWAFSIATGFTYTLTCKLQIKVVNLTINCLFFLRKTLIYTWKRK